MKTPVIHVTFTNGIGNNLFQYTYARLLAESHSGVVSISIPADANYTVSDFARLGINLKKHSASGLPIIKIDDKNASTKFYAREFDHNDFVLKGYFEDYELYVNWRDQVKSWFIHIEKTNTRDLVFHLRLGDRLFYKVSYRSGMKVDPSQYVNAINRFEFDRLHIVTDMKSWGVLTEESLSKMSFHIFGVGGKELLGTNQFAGYRIAVDYFNSIFETLNKFEPIVRYNQPCSDDINYIRSFDKILFQHSTLAWWAAFTSCAREVGVYGLWRPAKGKRNKNLSQVDLPGWFTWS